MAGTVHQGILLLLREDPWLVFDLLGLAHPVRVALIGRIAEVERPGDSPLSVRQAYPDLVLSTREPEPAGRGMVSTIEVQLALDRRKRWMIPVYQSHIAAEHELPSNNPPCRGPG